MWFFFHDKSTISPFVTFGWSGEKHWPLSALSVFSGYRNSLNILTNEYSFKIKSRTSVLLKNIVKLGFRAITSEIYGSQFVTNWTQNSQRRVICCGGNNHACRNFYVKLGRLRNDQVHWPPATKGRSKTSKTRLLNELVFVRCQS